jgi:transposase InsO family protein
VKKSEQGAMVAMSIPVDSEKFGAKLRKALFKKIPPLSLNDDENGVDRIMEFLEEKLGREEILCKLESFQNIVRYIRKPHQGFKEYLNEFELLVNDCTSVDVDLPDEILSLLLLINSSMNEMQYTLIKSNLNIKNNKGKLYKTISGRMMETLTNSMGDIVNKKGVASEDVMIAEDNHDVLVAQGWRPPKKQGYKGYNRVSSNENNGQKNNYYKSKHRQNQQNQQHQSKPLIGTNRIGSDGKRMQCIACKSTFHLIAECPHAKKRDEGRRTYQHKDKSGTYLVEVKNYDEDQELLNNYDSSDSSDQEYVGDQVLYTSPEQMGRFVQECLGSGSLDTGCTASVAGKLWFKDFQNQMSKRMREKLEGPLTSGRTFMFGNQGVLKSGAMYKLPIKLGGEEHVIEVDIIDSDIPLLISRKEMKRLDLTIDNKTDSVTMKGRHLPVMITSAGHLSLDLLGRKEQVHIESVLTVDLLNADETTQRKTLMKLHKQFGHRSKRAFVILLKNCEKWDDKFSAMIDQIIDGCEGCIMVKRNPDRPVVALPLGNDFNHVVTMDLKIWKGKNILYMIDSFTRYTVAVVVPTKEPDMIVDGIMTKWVQYFGIMDGILTDNGGEFSSELTREVCSILNVLDHTTGAEAPWSNGLCERNHALADNILQSVMRDYPNMKLNIALAWTCNAKNALINIHGYSPYQLVFGRQPKLPNVINDPPPAWEIKTKSKKLVENLTMLHATRQAYMKAENCERLKRALRTKIRTSSAVFEHGDIVYYKREGEEEFRGPAKAMFQDGKVVFVRHGGYVVKVSVNRLIKAGKELERQIREENMEFTKDKPSEQTEKKETQTKKKSPTSTNVETDTDSENEAVEEEHEREPEQDIKSDNESNTEENEEERVNQQTDSESEERPRNEQASDNNTPMATVEQNIANQANIASNTRPTTANQVIAAPIKLKSNDRIEVREGDKWQGGIVLGHAGKVTGKFKNCYNFQLDNGKTFNDDVTKIDVRKVNPEQALMVWAHEEVLAVMVPKDKRNTPECAAAKDTELNKLKDFETYKVVEDIGQPRISTTWVMTEKGDEVRARLTARGYEEEDEFPKDSPTMQKCSLRLLLTLATLLSFRIQTTDIKSAFLQGSKLEREVFVKPPKEAESKGKLWRLEKCLYGLKDASRQWYKKVADKLKELGFQPSKYDAGLFFKIHGGQLIGLVGLHVDDFLTAGNTHFRNVVLPELLSTFKVGKSESDSFMYTGFKLTQSEQGIILDQSHYVQNIRIPMTDAKRMQMKDESLNQEELTEMRELGGVINWTVRTSRPDLSFDMIDISTKFKGGKVQDLANAKKVVSNLKRNPAHITISNVGNIKACEIWCFSDAAFRNLNDGEDSAGGFVILLVNVFTGKCAPIDWKANKIKRKVASTLAAETISLGSALDAAVAIRDMISEITGNKIRLQVKAIVDNKSCRDAIYSTTSVSERRLRAEIAVIKEFQAEFIISEVKWIRGQHMLADIMTKKGVNSLPLMSVMQTGRLSHEMMEVCR